MEFSYGKFISMLNTTNSFSDLYNDNNTLF